MNEDELDGKAARLVAAWNTKSSDIDIFLEEFSRAYKNLYPTFYKISKKN